MVHICIRRTLAKYIFSLSEKYTGARAHKTNTSTSRTLRFLLHRDLNLAILCEKWHTLCTTIISNSWLHHTTRILFYNAWKITQVIYCQFFFGIRTSSTFDYNYFVHTTKSVVRISVYNNSANRSEVGLFVTLTVSFRNKKLLRIVLDPMLDVIFVEVTSHIV